MKIIGLITGSFSSVFGGIFKFLNGFIDRSTRFDEKETQEVMDTLAKNMIETKSDKAEYARGKSRITFEKFGKKDEVMRGRE